MKNKTWHLQRAGRGNPQGGTKTIEEFYHRGPCSHHETRARHNPKAGLSFRGKGAKIERRSTRSRIRRTEREKIMHHIMAKFWWILAARGLLGLLLGVVSLAWILVLGGFYPDIFGMSIFAKWASVVATLVLLLGLYAFVDGLFAILLGAQDYGDGRRWWVLIVEGFLSIGLGLLTWFKPEAIVLVLLNWIAAWAILTGLLEIFQANDMNEYKERRRPFFYAGLCSVAFGMLILLFNINGIELVWLIGIYAFTSGIPLMVMAVRLRRFERAH